MQQLTTIRAKSGTNQEGAGAHNKRVIIDALRLNGTLSRADLARATRLTKQTISNLVEALELEGLVMSEDVVRKGRGQPSTPYGLVPDGAFAIGLQIDRHVTRAIAVDLVGNVLAKGQAALPRHGPTQGVPVILELVAQIRRELQASRPQSESRLAGLGVAMPGPFGKKVAGADDSWMMGAWQNYPLVDMLAEGTGLDVSLQNDAAACATAERMVGAAHGLDHAVCLYLGYGIGAGLILNGELYSGACGNAGEIGMALLSDGERVTPLEHRASMASLYHALGLDPASSDLHDVITEMVLNDDPAVAAWVETAARDLRWAVHLIETVFDPQSIIISASAPAPLANKLIAAVEPLLPSNAEGPDRVVPRLQAGMFDPWAVALGAAAEPIGRAFEPRFAALLK